MDLSKAAPPQRPGPTILTSDWTGLDPNLIAGFYAIKPVISNGSTRWELAEPGIEVHAPILDCDLNINLDWNSPFTSIGGASVAPLTTALLESGRLQAGLSLLTSFFGDSATDDAHKDSTAAELNSFGNQDAIAQLYSLYGKSNVTRLNSTQVFSGMQPLKFSMTMYFRAWAKPIIEVEAPVNQLTQWALPRKLSEQGFFASLANKKGVINSLFPSDAPQVLGFSYAGSSILPVVIESMQQSLTGPRNDSGSRLSVSVRLEVATLAAIDAIDWKNYGIK